VTRQLPDLTSAQEQSRQQFVICVLQLELHHFLVLQLTHTNPAPLHCHSLLVSRSDSSEPNYESLTLAPESI
jgi:hypothetical protein